MANLKNVIYLSNSDYETLVTTGTVTIGSKTLTYDENNVYITPEEVVTTTDNGLMSSTDKTKLDSITSQTAYTAKGSATKVPQITTNSYGQVTGITEVTITQPTTTSQLTNNSNFVSGTSLDSDYIVVGNGNSTVKKGGYTINGLKEIAEGKTASFVIATKTCITGTEDGSTKNFTSVTQILTAPTGITGSEAIPLSSFNIGDNIFVKATETPDYWVSGINKTGDTVTSITLNVLETTKVDLTNYAPKSHATNATTYGAGTTTNYGHVKLKTGDISSETATDGVAASSSHNHDNSYYPKTGNPSGFLTGITSSDVTTALGFTPTANTGTVTSVNNVSPTDGNVNVGTVTSVNAGTGLSISGTSTLNPTVNVDSGYKLPTTNEWNNQDIDSWQADYTDTTNNFSAYRSCLTHKKIYTGIHAVANGSAPNNNTYANQTVYFLTVRPISWDAQWSIRYRLNVHLDDETQKYRPSASGSWEYPGQYVKGTYDCSIQGTAGTYNTFHFFQSQKNTSYRPIYYHMIHETTTDGYNAGYGHKIGVCLYNSYRPTPVTDYSSGSAVTSTKYTRTIEVILDECINCTVTLNDALEIEADAYRSDYTKLPATITVNGASKNCYTTNSSSSNSAGRWINLAATTQGLYESGDDNTYTYTQSTYNYLVNGTKNNGTAQYLLGYSLIGFDKDGKALAISRYSSSQTTSTTSMSAKGTRLYCDVGFDYTKGIRYINTSSNFAGGGNVNISPSINHAGVDFRYTDNCVAAAASTTMGLLNYCPVYLRGTIGSDGLFYLAPIDVTYNNTTYQRAWVQERDGFEAGYVYWFIGYPYYNGSYLSGYQFNLYSAGGLVEYVGGQLRPYVNTGGYTLGAASEKALATTISSSDTGLPTANQVYNYIDKNSLKMYSTAEISLSMTVSEVYNYLKGDNAWDIQNPSVTFLLREVSEGQNSSQVSYNEDYYLISIRPRLTYNKPYSAGEPQSVIYGFVIMKLSTMDSTFKAAYNNYKSIVEGVPFSCETGSSAWGNTTLQNLIHPNSYSNRGTALLTLSSLQAGLRKIGGYDLFTGNNATNLPLKTINNQNIIGESGDISITSGQTNPIFINMCAPDIEVSTTQEDDYTLSLSETGKSLYLFWGSDASSILEEEYQTGDYDDSPYLACSLIGDDSGGILMVIVQEDNNYYYIKSYVNSVLFRENSSQEELVDFLDGVINNAGGHAIFNDFTIYIYVKYGDYQIFNQNIGEYVETALTQSELEEALADSLSYDESIILKGAQGKWIITT